MLNYAIIFLALTSLSVESCKDIFKYYSDNNGPYGEIIATGIQLEKIFRIEVHLSVAAAISDKGKIILLNTDVYNDLLAHRDLRYKIVLPIQNPLPVATEVIFNGRTVCEGPAAQGSYISTIKLFHTYTLSYVPPQPANYYSKPPQVYKPPPVSTAQPFYTAPPQPPPVYTPTPPVYTPPPPVYTTTVRRPITYRQTSPTVSPTNFRVDVDTISFQCGVPIKLNPMKASFIIGGISAARGEFPWLAAFYDKLDGFICGATLVSKKFTVTSAHCVLNKDASSQRKPENAIFYMGKHHLNLLSETGYIASGVTQFFIHPDWSATTENYRGDIAMAHLAQSIEFSEYIQPLCIWERTHDHADIIGKRGLIAGWGITEKGTISEVPKYVSLPVVNDADCLRSNPTFTKITSSANFCVGDHSGRGPCQGDSGGAFMVKSNDNKFYLRGLVSAGIVDYGTCNDREYTVFTDTALYSDWVLSHIRQNI